MKKLNLPFDKGIHYIYSPNGTGKTNLLEAIQLLTVGKSLRAESEIDVLTLKSKNAKLVVEGEFEDEDSINFKQSVTLEKGETKKKVLSRNKNKISINDYVGRTPSIWFSLESIKIISSSPLNKRKYFDNIMIQLFPEYGYNLRAFNRSLKQRNRVLQDQNIDKNQIKVWTQNLLNYGCKIINSRKEFFQILNTEFENIKDFPRYKFRIEAIPSIRLSEIFDEDCEYKYLSELQKTYQKDLENKSTTKGPHKDDWDLKVAILPNEDFISAEKFASRGQQRMALIILQIVLINIFIKVKEVVPIMLLDDIFSELDKENEKILLDFIKEKKIQTFITGVDKLSDKKINQILLVESL